jgi:magnesium chelatase subunit I
VTQPATLGDLRGSEYRTQTVREEMRRNLVQRLAHGRPPMDGIVGYDTTVLPQIANALLAGQDMLLLGERGQAKTRIVRSLTQLLDDVIPVIAGCEINDDPHAPICRRCRELVAEQGDAVPIAWLPRDQRYSEKLATPDTSIADLVGEVDPIRVAEGRYLSDELTIHYGLIPRTNRGIFAVNELPDLAERIQVGLLNLIEERDLQIRGYRVRLPLDVLVVATANPEDYTNRGRIITPLKDRFGAEIRTHYPQSLDDEILIGRRERAPMEDLPIPVRLPVYMEELVAELSQQARQSPQINQRSGVSVRFTIANTETLLANAAQRALIAGDREAVARVSDLASLGPSSTGKLELESWDEDEQGKVLERLTRNAVLATFRRHFAPQEFTDLLSRFDREGLSIEVSDGSTAQLAAMAGELPGVDRARQRLEEPATPAAWAGVMEFLLEGLHLSRRLNKTPLDGASIYGG